MREKVAPKQGKLSGEKIVQFKLTQVNGVRVTEFAHVCTLQGDQAPIFVNRNFQVLK